MLITGAGRGLGAVMSERLAHEGYRVFATMRRPSTPTVDGIIPITMDVASPASVDRAVRTIQESLGDAGLFALVNNAAILHAGPAERATADQIESQLRTNVAGPLLVTQRFLPLLRRGHGRIVNIGSINAQLPLPNWAVYSASKAALLALSDAVRAELAPENISVTVLTLGAFATDMRRRALETWPDEDDDLYEGAHRAHVRLVAMLDSNAGDPGLVGDALVDVLRADPAPGHCAVGEGIDDLLALAAQPADVRAAVLQELSS